METKTTDTEEQVLALLCGSDEPWTWGGDAHQCSISFERNGTGALDCGETQRSWIASEFNWTFSTEPFKADTGTWTISIQMTLTTRMHPQHLKTTHRLKGAALQEHKRNPPPPSEAPFPWAPLHSPAFRPKQYTMTLSRGNFIEPFHYFIKAPYPLFQSGSYHFAPNRFSHQLVFDKSPYPPREEWAEKYKGTGGGYLSGSLDYHHYWERIHFVRVHRDPTWADILDLGWWLSPSVGDGHSSRPLRRA